MKSSASTEASGWPRALSQSHAASRFVPWFLLCSLVFLYLQNFLLPYTPLYYSNDAIIFLNHAARMLDGEVIYRDFFQITTPGSELLFFILFKLFGPRAWVHNAVMIALGLSLAWLCLAISRKVITGWKAFLPSLLFLAFQFRPGLGATHHRFSVGLVMAAVAVIIERRSAARLAVAGALCGLASFFTQTNGLVGWLGFAVFVAWECRRQGAGWRATLKAEAYLGIAFLGTLTATLAYFVWQAGLERFLACTIEFPMRYYRSVGHFNTWSGYLRDLTLLDPEYHPSRWAIYLFTYALIPFVYVVFLFQYRRDARARLPEKWDRLMLLNFVGLSLFLGVAGAPLWYRLSSVALPGLILLAWLLNLRGRWRSMLAYSLGLAALVLLLYTSVSQQIGWRGEFDLPAGRTAFQNQVWYDQYQWLSERTTPSEYFFAASVHFYFPLRLRNPAEITFLTPTDYTRPEQVQKIIAGLEEHQVRLVYWKQSLDLPPGRPILAGDHLEPLRSYLRDHYQVVKTFAQGNYVWERK